MSVTFTATNGDQVNVSITHAAKVLDLLGFPFGDGTGTCPAGDFLGRVLVALGLVDVATSDEVGTPAVDDYALAGDDYAGPRWSDCGTDPGYYASILRRLHRLAEEAHRNGGRVRWS